MLIRLSDNIRGWKPPVKSLAPIDAIRAAWVSIVGAEVAKHCQPSDIREKTLTVLTRSGTWSQQLGFLEANILAAIAQLDSATNITELRFRVGKIALQQTRQRTKLPRVQQTMRLSTAAPPEETLEEMLTRMKARAKVRQRARGPRCLRCGLALDQGMLCAPCRQVESEERTHVVMRALTEAPWLSDEDLRRTSARVRDTEITAARRMLLTRWKRELDRLERKKTFSRGEPERAIAVAYVLLMTGLTPDLLTRAIMRYTLGPRVDLMLYGEL